MDFGVFFFALGWRPGGSGSRMGGGIFDGLEAGVWGGGVGCNVGWVRGARNFFPGCVPGKIILRRIT